MFGGLKGVIVAAAAVLAALPSASLLTSIGQLPPNFDKFLSFCAAVAGPIVFFAVYLMRDRFVRLPRITLVAISCLSTFIGLGFAWETYRYTTERIEIIPTEDASGKVVDERYVIPERLSQKLDTIVNGEHRGNWENAILAYGDQVTDLMHRDSLPVQQRILITFLLAHALLIVGILVAAWAAQKQLRPKDRE